MSMSFAMDGQYPENFLSSCWLSIEKSEVKIINKPEVASQNIFERMIFFLQRSLGLLTCYNNSLTRVSSHLIKSCNALDPSSLTHEQLANMVANVKAVNAKIHSHNKKIWTSLLASPTLDQQVLRLQNRLTETQIDKTIQNKMFFPSPEKFKGLDPKFLCEQWERNNEFLLGCIALNKTKPLSFTGQQPDGLNKLLDNHQTSSNALKDHIWVAGYNYALDPITFLADLTLIAKTAYCYSITRTNSYGGIFFVNPEDETAYSEKIGCNSGLCSFIDEKGLPIESDEARKFIQLTSRKNTTSPPNYQTFPKEGFVSTLKIPTTNEMVLTFNSSNYSRRIYGVLTTDQLVYSRSFISSLSKTHQDMSEKLGAIAAIPYCHRLFLAERFNYQQIVLQAFEKIGLFTNSSPEQLEKYRAKGAELMKQFDDITKIEVNELKKLAGAYWYRNENYYSWL